MIKSYCKINLSLRVLNKLSNGFHNIQSNTFLLKLHDTISIKKINRKKDNIIFKGKFKKSVNKSKNSVLDALFLLRQNKVIPSQNNYKVIINKKVPVYSGLGGGTSNAAFLIKYFTKKDLSNFVLNNFEKKIGSDLRLFSNKQNFQESLKKVKKFKKKFNFYFILVYPYLKCSTKEIYSRVKNFSSPKIKDPTSIKSKNEFINFIKKEQNDLERISYSKFNVLRKIINCISIQKGCLFSRMTGSGSVCFGMFKNQKLAISGLRIIKKRFPRYWCVITKTI
tara:strand:+ start:207 stop:1046 length:840 start_codon:yes stop_codon:yes gene_type:complete